MYACNLHAENFDYKYFELIGAFVATITVRIDDDTKKGAEKVFRDLGLSTATAINVFFRQVKRENAIPFKLQSDDLPQRKTLRKAGGLKGEIWMADDFDAPLEEFEAYL